MTSPATEPEPEPVLATGPAADPTTGPATGPLADCVHCGEPTEYPASTRGITLCPVCEWQEAQRTACSG